MRVWILFFSISHPCLSVHFENPGVDRDEGVEVAGTAGTDLTGWKILIYSGETKKQHVKQQRTLSPCEYFLDSCYFNSLCRGKNFESNGFWIWNHSCENENTSYGK